MPNSTENSKSFDPYDRMDSEVHQLLNAASEDRPMTEPSATAREEAEKVEVSLDLTDEPAASMSRRDAIALALAAFVDESVVEERAGYTRTVEEALRQYPHSCPAAAALRAQLATVEKERDSKAEWVNAHGEHCEPLTLKHLARAQAAEKRVATHAECDSKIAALMATLAAIADDLDKIAPQVERTFGPGSWNARQRARELASIARAASVGVRHETGI